MNTNKRLLDGPRDYRSLLRQKLVILQEATFVKLLKPGGTIGKVLHFIVVRPDGVFFQTRTARVSAQTRSFINHTST